MTARKDNRSATALSFLNQSHFVFLSALDCRCNVRGGHHVPATMLSLMRWSTLPPEGLEANSEPFLSLVALVRIIHHSSRKETKAASKVWQFLPQDANLHPCI